MENERETTMVSWGYTGIMEKTIGNYYLGFRVEGDLLLDFGVHYSELRAG